MTKTAKMQKVLPSQKYRLRFSVLIVALFFINHNLISQPFSHAIGVDIFWDFSSVKNNNLSSQNLDPSGLWDINYSLQYKYSEDSPFYGLKIGLQDHSFNERTSIIPVQVNFFSAYIQPNISFPIKDYLAFSFGPQFGYFIPGDSENIKDINFKDSSLDFVLDYRFHWFLESLDFSVGLQHGLFPTSIGYDQKKRIEYLPLKIMTGVKYFVDL